MGHLDVRDHYLTALRSGAGLKGWTHHVSKAVALHVPVVHAMSAKRSIAYEESVLTPALGQADASSVVADAASAVSALAQNQVQAAAAAIDQAIALLRPLKGSTEDDVAAGLLNVLGQARARVTGTAAPEGTVFDTSGIEGMGALPDASLTDPPVAVATVTPGAAGNPTSVDLMPGFAAVGVYDQGDTESCVSNATAGLIEYAAGQQQIDFSPSRMFLWYDARVYKNPVGGPVTNAGTSYAATMQALAEQGVAAESSFPFESANVLANPGAQSYLSATYAHATATAISGDVTSIEAELALGNPLAVAINLTSTFPTFHNPDFDPNPIPASDPNYQEFGAFPVIPTPSSTKTGGHGVVFCGYVIDSSFSSEGGGAFILRNSWGSNWADGGYALMPFSVWVESKQSQNALVYYLQSLTVTPSTPSPPYIGDIAPLSASQTSTGLSGESGQIFLLNQSLLSFAPSGTNQSQIYTKNPAFFAFQSIDSELTQATYVTPLLFEFDPTTGTYTLKSIGNPDNLDGLESADSSPTTFGFPYLQYGSAGIDSNTYFAFYDGSITDVDEEGSVTYTLAPNIGVVAYSAASSTAPSWVQTTTSPSGLQIGQTISFSTSSYTFAATAGTFISP